MCNREAILLSSQHKNEEMLTECQLVLNVTAGLKKKGKKKSSPTRGIKESS